MTQLSVPTEMLNHRKVMRRSWTATLILLVAYLLPLSVIPNSLLWWDRLAGIAFSLSIWVALAATVTHLWRRWRWRDSD